MDVLFEVKNSYYLGNYQQCISEAQKLRPSNEDEKIWRDCFLYRAYIAQKKYSIPMDEINSNSAPELTAVRSYADYLANEHKRSSIVADLEEKMAAGVGNNMFYLMAAMIYMKEKNFESALRMLHHGDDLECQALKIQCQIRIHRVDLAIKEVKKMQEADEDATITQLAQAWTNLAVGKDKLQDAFYIFQEMIDKYGQTALLLVSQAACLIQQHKYEPAETLLEDALKRDPNYAEALINLIVVGQFLGKPPEHCNRYINQLKEGHPTHPWTKDLLAAEKSFDRIALESSA